MDIDQAITAVRAAVARVDQMQEAVAAAKDALQREALRALLNAEGDAETRELVGRLYWEVPELPTKAIEAVIGNRTRVFTLAGPGPVIGACEDCGAGIRATSRTHAASGASVCTGCEQTRRKVEREAQRLRSREPTPESWLGWEDELDEPSDESYPCC